MAELKVAECGVSLDEWRVHFTRLPADETQDQSGGVCGPREIIEVTGIVLAGNIVVI